MDRLAEETLEDLEKQESSAFSCTLARGELPLESYVGLIHGLAIVHATLEARLKQCQEPTVQSVWGIDMQRYPLLQRDLNFFESRQLATIPAALSVAHAMAKAILLRSRKDPVSLLGCLYALERARQGASALRQAAAVTFGLEAAQGLEYLTWSSEHGDESWSQFGRRMGAANLDAATEQRVGGAAHELYTALLGLLQALFPLPALSTLPVASALNPEAGTHPICTDAREIDAALRAGERCRSTFPYFEARYGERGRRFTSSDGAWLVTLSELDQVQTNRQVLWLGRLLAVRGMPRITLEMHLRMLFEELVLAVPERASHYERLSSASLELRRVRLEQIDGVSFERLSDEFASAVAGQASALPNVGPLLLSAVADERDGLAGVVSSLQAWLVNPSRFSAPWIAAVFDTLDKAQQASAHRKSPTGC